MQQYFAKNKKLELEDSDYKHIKNVMRMKKGDIIRVSYDEDVFLCKITEINDKVIFDVIEKLTIKEKKYKLISAFSLLKEQKLDYLLQKSTEAGIDEFIPLITNRSIIKYDSKKDDKKNTRWKKILKEASEQSFRNKIPDINYVMTIKELINVKADLKILFTLNNKTKNIKKILQNSSDCDTILFVTGPEGGFSIEEEQFLIDNGFICASLGDYVLRSETAPVVVASMINYEFMR